MVRPALALFLYSALVSSAWADCRCLYAGGEAEQGETACIKTADGPTLARCEMVLNNSSWTVLNTPCDVKQSTLPIPPNMISARQG
jgi:hypothetical protein